jgi:NADPH:quinone reductase-like Zn-dependent oxidoreductase
MKAVRIQSFGGVENLQLTTQPIPEPGAGEVRVRVMAVSLNPIDSKIRVGAMKLMSGSRFPMALGFDLAGIVDAIGAGVSGLAVGDAVFGGVPNMPGGAYAEFVITTPGALAKKPAKLSFEEAAAVPVAGIAALAGLRDLAHLSPGMEVLINGCTGGVGSFAVQIARILGAKVVGTCSDAGMKLASQLGAQEVINYRSQDLSAQQGRFDTIFEMSGRLSFHDAKPLMKPRSVYVDPIPTPSVIVGSALTNPFRSQKRKPLLGKVTHADLSWLAAELSAGRLVSTVGRVFPFEEIQAATQAMEKGGVLGKIVLRVAEP